MKKLVALLLCLMMVVPATLASAETAEGKVLNIWCWNDEFQSRFNDYYPGVKEVAADKSTTTLDNGVTVKWTINPNDNNNYQNKLDEALRAQESAAADDKIDIFLIEADYAGNAFTQCFGIYGPFISEPAGCGFQSHAEFVQSGIVVRSDGRLKSILEAVGSDTAGVVFNNEASGLPQ